MSEKMGYFCGFFLMMLLVFCNGCTLIGYGIGTVFDNSHNNSHDTSASYTVPIFLDANDHAGQFAKIQYRDSTNRFALFEGFKTESDSAYQARSNSFMKEFTIEPKSFKIGDTIETPDSISFDYQGNSFYQTFLFNSYMPGAIEFYTLDGSKRATISLSALTYMGLSGHGNELRATQRMLDSNTVPIRAILRFTDTTTFRLTNSDFSNAYFMQRSKTGGTIGLIVGGVIDAIILISILSSQH